MLKKEAQPEYQPCSRSADSDSALPRNTVAQEAGAFHGGTACMLAASCGHEAVVRLLLQSGAEVNAAIEVMRRRRALIV